MAVGTQNLKIIIDAVNNSEKAFRQVEKQMKDVETKTARMQKKIKAMKPTFQKMAVAGSVAFTGIALAVGSTVKAFQKQERAEARLTQLAKQTTGATNEQIDSLKQQAEALQKVGVIGDEVAIFGQSQLATFALQTDAIKELTPSMLDMVVATKGVNATQQDMIDVGNMVGKVMGGQVGALSRVGVVFSDAQGEILKTGTEMEKASALAEILQGNFGGLNESARATSEGGMKALSNTVGDIKEKIGESLIPIITDLVNKMQPVVEKVLAWITENPKLTRNIILVAGAISGLVAVVGMLGLILPVIITGFGLLFSPITAIVLLITVALIPVIMLLIQHWDTLKQGAITAFENIGETMLAWWGYVKAIFKGWVLEMKLTILQVKNFLNSMKEAFKSAFDWIGDKVIQPFQNQIEKITNSIENAIRKAKELANKAWDKVKGAVGMRASGGSVSSGSPYIVGERGAEMFVPNTAGRIVPNSRLAGMGGSSIVVNISGNMFANEDEMAERVGDRIIRLVKDNTKL